MCSGQISNGQLSINNALRGDLMSTKNHWEICFEKKMTIKRVTLKWSKNGEKWRKNGVEMVVEGLSYEIVTYCKKCDVMRRQVTR